MSPVSWFSWGQDPRGILQSVLAEARKPRPAKQLWPISNALQAAGASLQTSAEFKHVEYWNHWKPPFKLHQKYKQMRVEVAQTGPGRFPIQLVYQCFGMPTARSTSRFTIIGSVIHGLST